MMKKRILSLLVLIAFFVSGYGQSKKELIELGDAAFNAGNYGSAVFYYKRIVEFTPTKYDLIMPYEIKTFIKADKKNFIEKPFVWFFVGFISSYASYRIVTNIK